jgi:hypothetical protein
MFDFEKRLKGPVLLLPIFILLITYISTDRAVSQPDRSPVITFGDDVTFRLGGTFQPRFTYDHFGGLEAQDDDVHAAAFGLRRARLRLYGQIGRDLVVFTQVEGSGSSAQFLDLRAAYRLHNNLFIRAGRFAGAQPRAFAITLHSDIDAIDRAAIAEIWARNTIGADGRDFGAELYYKTSSAELRLFAHNGSGTDNFRPGTGGGMPSDDRGFSPAVSAFASFKPAFLEGLEYGIFAGYNPSENRNTAFSSQYDGRKYSNYAAHMYWGAIPGSQKFRIKADYIGIRYHSFELQSEETIEIWQQTLSGASLFVSAMPSRSLEAFTRLEFIDFDYNDDDHDTIYTLGWTWSMSAASGKDFGIAKLTLAWSGRIANGSANQNEPRHTITLQSQFYF